MAKGKIELKIYYIRIPVYQGVDLIIAREKAGLTQQRMAERCNSSKGTQHKREKPGEHLIVPHKYQTCLQIDEETLRIINEALNHG